MSNALDSASLIMVPSGYENGTLGSIKPTDGTGDFTFSRGSDISATRVNEDGNIEKGYENLFLQSNTFSDAAWDKFNLLQPVNGYEGYDGSNDAWKLVANSGTDSRIKQSFSTTGIITTSFYAKAAEWNYVGIYVFGSNKGVVWSLIDGSVQNPIISYPEIYSNGEDVGNGWWKFSMTHNVVSGDVRIWACEQNIYNGNTPDGVSGIYIQDAMLNQGLVAYPYVETTTAPVAGGILEDMPRLDYTDSSCPSLKLEPQRTNENPNSEYPLGGILSNAILSLSGTSPEGLSNAYALTENTSNAEHYWISERMTTATNNNLVSTIFVKPNGRTKIRLWNYHLANQMAIVDIDLINNTTSNGGGTNVSFVSADVTDYANGWKRVEIQSIKSGSTYAYGIRINLLDDSGNDVYVGDGTSGVYIYGAQMEQDVTYPTSYIPTYGVSQTRADEEAQNNIATTGARTYFIDGKRLDDANSANSSGFFYTNSGLQITYWSNNRLRFRFGSSINQYNTLSGSDFKVAVVFNGISTNKIFVNGSLSSSVEHTLSDNPGIDLRSEESSEINQTLFFPTALSDDECIALTTI